ncbi:D-2-hydroxyacid dehydrogenase [Comamonas endophytica]|uniref:D-2-hydroxyacid dehydrogenase n=1 Tax=Comamonas endophytica TaxID=2949090 RepID=A0ABY6GG66_9BURK|nr:MULTISPECIES: D-2-hydroxyacid dehydrogenase [unclassified Acidovorax]MCD2513142.1 D-2-hydroxyacid dehydrogenase [Acidovorax sp. D4N7]UYG53507.1 D-2-hydroxyacid dehydrogenase [Acidovorax sp. 5MLIR]
MPLCILVSEAARASHGGAIAHALAGCPHTLVTPDEDAALDAEIAFVSRDVTGLSTKHEVFPETQRFYDAMAASRRLRWVQVHSAGIDRAIYVQLQQRGVMLSTSAGSNAEVVAQTAVAGLLALGRRFPELIAAQRRGEWSPLIRRPLPPDIDGQTATIVGWGEIGQAIGRILTAVGLHIQVVRSSDAPTDQGFASCAYEDIARMLPRTDWLVLACPLTSRTEQLIDGAALRALPRGAGVINVARGAVLDEDALIAALESGHLSGAYLDVFTHEPLAPESALWAMPQVLATPHSAGFSAGNAERVVKIFLDNLRRYAQGQTLARLARAA